MRTLSIRSVGLNYQTLSSELLWLDFCEYKPVGCKILKIKLLRHKEGTQVH